MYYYKFYCFHCKKHFYKPYLSIRQTGYMQHYCDFYGKIITRKQNVRSKTCTLRHRVCIQLMRKRLHYEKYRQRCIFKKYHFQFKKARSYMVCQQFELARPILYKLLKHKLYFKYISKHPIYVETMLMLMHILLQYNKIREACTLSLQLIPNENCSAYLIDRINTTQRYLRSIIKE